jgi:hypothetical protein
MNRRIVHLFGAAALAAMTLQPITALADPPPHARNNKHDHDRRYDDQDYRQYDHRRYDDAWYEDDRYRRNERWQDYDPRRDRAVHRLPPRARLVHYRGDRYYDDAGTWYRPYRSGYAVVPPPLGLVTSFLPEYQSVVRYSGVPHYRAGPVDYVWQPKARGYVVTDQPDRRW